MDLSFRWFLSSLSTFVFFIPPDAPPSALLIVFIPSDHALSLTSFFPQCQTTFKVVTLVPNLFMSTIECLWRVHTEALLTCLRKFNLILPSTPDHQQLRYESRCEDCAQISQFWNERFAAHTGRADVLCSCRYRSCCWIKCHSRGRSESDRTLY